MDLLVAIVALFVFLLALGAYSPGEVVGLTVVMVVLFLLWIGHAVWLSRRSGRDPRAKRARAARFARSMRRERRGVAHAW